MLFKKMFKHQFGLHEGTCDSYSWLASLSQHDVHKEVAREGLGTLTAFVGGISLSS